MCHIIDSNGERHSDQLVNAKMSFGTPSSLAYFSSPRDVKYKMLRANGIV